MKGKNFKCDYCEKRNTSYGFSGDGGHYFYCNDCHLWDFDWEETNYFYDFINWVTRGLALIKKRLGVE